MNRRRVLTALAGAGLTGGSLWAARNGLGSSAGEGLPVSVETLAARGSTAGAARVPAAETVTVVDLFATWCPPCREQMPALAETHAEYGDRVAFVSVTNERVGGTLTRDDLREWWRANGGDWTLGLDPESDLLAALGASGIPYLAVLDPSGTVRWTHGGVASAAAIGRAVEAALGER